MDQWIGFVPVPKRSLQCEPNFDVNCMEYISTTNLYGTPFIIFKKLKKIGTMIDDFDEFNDSDSFDESNETTLMALINFMQEVLRYLIR